MTELPEQLPNDIELLKQLITHIANERNDFFERLKILEERYKQEMRNKYGRKSETFDPDQLRLFAGQLLEEQQSAEEQPLTEKPGKGEKKSGHGRRKPSPVLPRKPVIHDIPEAEKTCSVCTWQRELMGRTVTLQLDYIPGMAFYWEHIRLKYACRTCEAQVVSAPMPDQPIERGMPAAGMLAYIPTAKLADHLPLYRLEDILSRQGLVLSRSTMCDWMAKAAQIVGSVYRFMIEQVRLSKVIWTDDTPIRVQDRTLEKRCRTGRIWVYRGDAEHPFIVYHYTPSRKRDGPVEFLKNYTGFLQADAFAGYDCIYVGGAVKEVACFAHARRKFVNAMDTNRSACSQVLQVIQQLYDLEREYKRASADQRLAARQEVAVPLLANLKQLLDQFTLISLPKSPLGQAITYAMNNWLALNVYTTDGDLTIDNNLAENALRPIALGRKNWLFAGSDSGGETCAILSSLIATCRRHQVDPFLYLRTLISRLTENPEADPQFLVPGVLELEPIQR